jgi:hypothetical protein
MRSGIFYTPLQARYLFAMDFHTPDLYVTMFTEDGSLDVGSGESLTISSSINGQWSFSKRRIDNEQPKEWAYTGAGNPAW